jgi:spoIIIJ-associated protein
MIKEITAMGKDVVEAKENARAALGADALDDVKFEILHAGSKGIFGIIGVKPAQVRAYMELPDPEERHRRKSERPHREERHEGEKKEGSKNKKRRHNDKKKSERNEKPKAIAQPEAELNLEERVVSTGEDMSFDFVTTLIANIGLSAEAKLYSCEDGTRRIIIKGDDASTLIGHHGDTLDALQYLANLASARKNANGERDKSRVTVDIEGYRAKREETLRALARRMAQKALRNKRSVMLEPMSAYERRIIHSEIQGIEGVSTNSIGSDNNRKIVIFLTDKKPTELFEEDEKKNAATAEISVEEITVAEDMADEEISSADITTDEE